MNESRKGLPIGSRDPLPRAAADGGPASGKPAKQQFNVYLPPDLIRRAKYRSLDEQLSLSDLVERALTAYLNDGDRHA